MPHDRPTTHNRLLGVPLSVWIAFFCFANLVLAFPMLDLAVSDLFFDPHAGFPINGTWWERLLYHSIDAAIAASILVLILGWWRGRKVSSRQLLLLLALLVLVPGILVNLGLKEHLGRARPVDVQPFGGRLEFTPAFVPTDQSGGSFSSGHAAAACFLVAVAVELARVRSAWFLLALGYAIAIGMIRIASGSHFLSDVLASGFFVWLGYLMLAAALPERASAS